MFNINQNKLLPTHNVSFLIVLTIVLIWTLIWKGIALWKSARNNQKAWFIVLLIINTIGILEIIYIYFFQSKLSKKKK